MPKRLEQRDVLRNIGLIIAGILLSQLVSELFSLLVPYTDPVTAFVYNRLRPADTLPAFPERSDFARAFMPHVLLLSIIVVTIYLAISIYLPHSRRERDEQAQNRTS